MNFVNLQKTKTIYKNQLHVCRLAKNYLKRKLIKQCSYIKALKRIKYFRINLTNEVKDLSTENQNTLMQKIEDK